MTILGSHSIKLVVANYPRETKQAILALFCEDIVSDSHFAGKLPTT